MPRADAAATLDGQAANLLLGRLPGRGRCDPTEERNRLARERYYAEQEALRKARDEEAARRLEREYQRAISAGGAVAANARWERLSDETLAKYGGRYDLCQWEDEDANGNFLGRRCTRRTADVYCWRHNRQLERESERRRREEAEATRQSSASP